MRHTFIRREIAALEEHGFDVARFSIKPPPAALIDPADLAERERTQVLLDAGLLRLILATFSLAVRHPWRWCQALWLAIRMGRRSRRGIVRHLAYLLEAGLLVQRLRAADIEHVHAHFGTNPAAVALLAHMLSGLTYSLTIHGSEEWDRPESLSLEEKYQRATFIASASEFGRAQVFRWCSHEHWDKVHVVRCGVDSAFLDDGPQPVPDNSRLVAVGALAEQKGHLRLLSALARLKAQGIWFEMVLAGDGPLRWTLEEEIHRRGLQRRVRITGWLSNQAIRHEILQARAVILPSFAENLPVVLMESLALGRPVVSSQLAGIPELVEPGVSGWLVPAGSDEALSAAISEVLQAPVDRLEQMGQAGAERVRELHDARIEAAHLAMLFRSYVGGCELAPRAITKPLESVPSPVAKKREPIAAVA